MREITLNENLIGDRGRLASVVGLTKLSQKRLRLPVYLNRAATLGGKVRLVVHSCHGRC